MRFLPTARFQSLSLGVSRVIRVKVQVRNSASIGDALSAGTWTDVTAMVDKDCIGDITSQIDLGIGEFTADAIEIVGLSIAWWDANVLNKSGFTEFRVDMTLGASETDIVDADGGTVFCGLLDTATVKPNQAEDTVSFSAYTHDDWGRRNGADGVTQQIIDPATGYVMLNSVPDIEVANANISGYPLLRGIHVINYDFNGGAPRVNLDGGLWVALTAPGTYTLGNGASTPVDTQRVTVYSTTIYLSTGSSVLSQEILITEVGQPLPKTWLSRVDLVTMIGRLAAKFGINTVNGSSGQISTFDGRNATTLLNIPPGTDTFVGNVGAILYDPWRNGIWFGIGQYLFWYPMDTRFYVLVADFGARGTIYRLLPELLVDGRLIVMSRDSSNYWWVTRVDAAARTVAAYDKLTNRGTDTSSTSRLNFAMTRSHPSFGTAGYGIIYYCASGKSVYYFDVNARTETKILPSLYDPDSAPYSTRPDQSAFCDGTDYYLQEDAGSGNSYYCSLHYNGGTPDWEHNTIAGAISTLEEVVWHADDSVAYYVSASVLKKITTGGTITTVDAGNSYANLQLVQATPQDNPSYVSALRTTPGSAGTLYRPCLIRASAVDTWFDAIDRDFPSIGYYSESISAYIFAYARRERLWFGVTKYQKLLFQYGAKIVPNILTDAKLRDMTLMDVIRELCIAWMFSFTVNSDKTASVYQRVSDAGNPVDSGNVLQIDSSMVETIEVNRAAQPAYGIVEVSNGTSSISYDGEAFFIDKPVLPTPKLLLSVSSKFIPTPFLKDVAAYIFRCFSTPLDEVIITLAGIPAFQWAPFDGIIFDVQTATAAYRGRGVIKATRIAADGNLMITAQVPSCAMMDHSLYDDPFSTYS